MSKNLLTNSNGIFIESQNVIKKFGNTQVLKELNLTINSGEFVCIVGRSGCGKSTFLRLLAGLEKASLGEITLDGSRNRWCSSRCKNHVSRFKIATMENSYRKCSFGIT